MFYLNMFEWLVLLFLHKERDYIEIQSFKFRVSEEVRADENPRRKWHETVKAKRS